MTDRSNKTAPEQPGSLAWLAAGALGGLILAGVGLLERSAGDPDLPPGTVAQVNTTLISKTQLDRAVAALRGTPAEDVSDADRGRILEQLIDEELLVQRGVELDMVSTEATVRGAIVQSMVASVTAEADAANPTEEELERFLEEHAADYTFASALAVDAWVGDDERQAQEFVAGIRNSDGAATSTGLRRVPGLPESPMPLEQLRMFVGPAIAAAAVNMPAGSSAVYARQGRWYVLRVNQHAESLRAPLEAVRSQVLLDYRRNLANQMLKEYLERLRLQSDVVLPASQ